MTSFSHRLAGELADELRTFKSDINLVSFACSRFGFVVSKTESSQACYVLRNPARSLSARKPDKLVVSVDTDGHWIYFNVHDQNDSGTIIDLVQQREPASIKDVRIILRAFTGSKAPDVIEFKKPDSNTFDREQIIAKSRFFRFIESSEYLTSRGIPASTLASNRFKHCVLEDKHGNVVFPHYDDTGLTGYELKGPDLSAFAKSGKRSTWYSACFKEDKRLVFTESGIEALSYDVLFGDRFTRYYSFAGTISGFQQILISKILVNAANNHRDVICAFNNDEKGREYTELVCSLAPDHCRIDAQSPEGANDWNDQLCSGGNFNGL